MMPKGVEHKGKWSSGDVILIVRIPMMPKGVEHVKERKNPAQGQKVRIPMMPKGVEHSRSSGKAAVLNAFRHHRH